jgi:predicted phage-related endonuclease
MALTGCEYWDLAVLIGGAADFRIYNLRRDADLEDMVVTEADRWWQAHVVADTPPDPSTELEARQRWARHRPGKVVTLPPLAIGGLRSLAKVKADMAALRKLEQALRDELIPDFEDADELRDADSNLLGTYRANKATCKTDWKAVAEDALAEFDDDLSARIIADHTTSKPGARVLRLAKTLEVEK